MVTVCTTKVNIKLFYILPTECISVHVCVCVCILFLWLSEQTMIIFLYSIN